jgi:hypothetical protein
MKKLAVLFALLGVVALVSGASAIQNAGSVGIGHGIAVPGNDTNPCPGSTNLLNYDGTAENGYCWQYGGVVPGSSYGAFAEGYDAGGAGYVCGIELFLTSIGNPSQPADLYVWDSDGTNPNNVLSLTSGVAINGVGMWPSITQFDLGIGDTAVTGAFFVGYWANFSGQGCGYFIAADLDGFGGLPRTNIAPGIGYPTGWQDPSGVWGPTMALGIGCYLRGSTPTQETTWGAIKHLYN